MRSGERVGGIDGCSGVGMEAGLRRDLGAIWVRLEVEEVDAMMAFRDEISNLGK